MSQHRANQANGITVTSVHGFFVKTKLKRGGVKPCALDGFAGLLQNMCFRRIRRHANAANQNINFLTHSSRASFALW